MMVSALLGCLCGCSSQTQPRITVENRFVHAQLIQGRAVIHSRDDNPLVCQVAMDTTRRRGLPLPFSQWTYETPRRDGGVSSVQTRAVMDDGLIVQKEFRLGVDDPALRVHVRLQNSSNQPLVVGYRSHNLAWHDDAQSVLLRLPTRRGLMRRTDNVDYLVRDLADGWVAAVDPQRQSGLVCLFEKDKVSDAFCWVGNPPTLEWIYGDLTLQPGETWSADLAYVHFTGLGDVNIAEDEFIGQLRIDDKNAPGIVLDAYGRLGGTQDIQPILLDVSGKELARLEVRSLTLRPGEVTSGRWPLPDDRERVDSVTLAVGARRLSSPPVPLERQYRDDEIDPVPLSHEFRSYVEKLLVDAESRCDVPASSDAWNAQRKRLLDGLTRTIAADLPRYWPALKPRLEGATQRALFRIEQVSAEFWPGVRYAMHVFVPEGTGPFPAVILMTTSPEGGRSPFYQNLLAGLAQVGILAVGVTPLGKGARYGPRDAYVYNEAAMLVGTSIRQEQHHTATRTLEYLLSRTDVDPTRIGITGASNGGGTALMASVVEPRIAAAAPACINWTFSKWMLPGRWQNVVDEETAAPGLLTYGANIPTLIASHAPRPLRLFNAAGESDLLDQIPLIDARARRAYSFADAPLNYQSSLADCEHGYWPEISAQFIPWIYEWFFARPLPVTVRAGEKIPADPFAQRLLMNGKPVDVVTADDPQFPSLRVADLEEDGGAEAFLKIIEQRRLDARAHRRALIRRPDQLRSELLRALGLDSLQPPASVRDDGESVRMETEPGMFVRMQWVKRDPADAGRVTLVLGDAPSRRRAQVVAGNRLDLQMREELSLGPDLSILVLLNRPPLGMWVWDALCATRRLRASGYRQIDLLGAGEAGAIIAILTALLDEGVSSVGVVGEVPLSLEERLRKPPRKIRYWADRLLWVTDLPDAMEILRTQRRVQSR